MIVVLKKVDLISQWWKHFHQNIFEHVNGERPLKKNQISGSTG